MCGVLRPVESALGREQGREPEIPKLAGVKEKKSPRCGAIQAFNASTQEAEAEAGSFL